MKKIELKDYINILFEYYRENETQAQFVRKIFGKATNEELLFPDDSLPGKIFRGDKKLSNAKRNVFIKFFDKDSFIEYLNSCNLTDDAKEYLVNYINERQIYEREVTLDILEECLAHLFMKSVNSLAQSHSYMKQEGITYKLDIFNQSKVHYKRLIAMRYLYEFNQIDKQLISVVSRSNAINAVDYIIQNPTNNFYITGDGGVGKTTLASFFMHLAFNNKVKKVPIYVHSSNLVGANTQGYDQDFYQTYSNFFIIKKIVEQLTLKNSEDIFEKINCEFCKNSDNKEYLLIIDGLNEIGKKYRERLVKQLNKVAKIWDNLQIIIMGRDIDNSKVFISDFFEHFVLCGVEQEVVLSYLKQNSIESKRLGEELLQTIKNPFFLLHFCNSYDESSNSLVSKGDILDHYFSINSEKIFDYNQESIIENLHMYDEISAAEKKFIVGYILPYVFFCMRNDLNYEITIKDMKRIIINSLEFSKGESIVHFFDYFNSLIPYLEEYLFQVDNHLGNFYHEQKLLNIYIDFFTVFFAVFNSFSDGGQLLLLCKHQAYMDYFYSKHIQNMMNISYIAFNNNDCLNAEVMISSISNIWDRDIIELLGDINNDKLWIPYFDTALRCWRRKPNASCTEVQLEILRSKIFTGHTQYTYNVIETLKLSRGDLSGCDLSGCDLTICKLSGVNFGHLGDNGMELNAVFDRCTISEQTFSDYSHSASIIDVLYALDSSIITYAKDFSLIVWNKETKLPSKSFRLNGDNIILEPKNKFIVTSLYNNQKSLSSLCFWSLQDGSQINSVNVNSSRITCNYFFSDNLIISGTKNGNLYTINLESFTVKKVGEHRGAVLSIEKYNESLLTSGEDGIKIWDIETGNLLLFQKKREKNIYIQYADGAEISIIEKNRKSDSGKFILLLLSYRDDVYEVAGFIEPLNYISIKKIIYYSNKKKAIAISEEKMILLDTRDYTEYKFIQALSTGYTFDIDSTSCWSDSDGNGIIGSYIEEFGDVQWTRIKKSMQVLIEDIFIDEEEMKAINTYVHTNYMSEWNLEEMAYICDYPPRYAHNEVSSYEDIITSDCGNYLWIVSNINNLVKLDMRDMKYQLIISLECDQIYQVENYKDELLFVLCRKKNKIKVVEVSDNNVDYYEYPFNHLYTIPEINNNSYQNNPSCFVLNKSIGVIYIVFSVCWIVGFDISTHKKIYEYSSEHLIHVFDACINEQANELLMLTTNPDLNRIVEDSKEQYALLDGTTFTIIDLDKSEYSYLKYVEDDRANQLALNTTGMFINHNHNSILHIMRYISLLNIIVLVDRQDTLVIMKDKYKQLFKGKLIDKIIDVLVTEDETEIFIYSRDEICYINLLNFKGVRCKSQYSIKKAIFSKTGDSYFIISDNNDIFEIQLDTQHISKSFKSVNNIKVVGCSLSNVT